MNQRKARSFLFNSISAYVPFIVDFALKLLIIRIIHERLGTELLGTWGIVKAAALFPLFVQQGLTFAIFVETSRSGHKSRSDEALVIVIGFGLLVALVFTSLAAEITSFFPIPFENKATAILAFRIAGIAFLFSSVSSMFIQMLQGLGRFDLSSLILSFNSALTSICSILLLHRGYQIVSLFVVELIVSLLCVPLGLFLCWKMMGRFPFLFSLSANRILSLLREAAGQLSLTALTKVIWELDAFLILRFFGISRMAGYWMGQRLVFGWRAFLWAGAWAAVPATAGASASGESQRRIQNIHLLQVSLAIPAAALLWNFSDSIIQVWISRPNPTASITLKILILAGLIDFLPAAFVSSLIAQGRIFRISKILLGSATVKVALSTVACFYGSYSGLLLSTLAAALLFSMTVHRIIARAAGQRFYMAFKPLLPASIASAISLFLFQWTHSTLSLYTLAGEAALFLLLAYSITLLFVRIFFSDVLLQGVHSSLFLSSFNRHLQNKANRS